MSPCGSPRTFPIGFTLRIAFATLFTVFACSDATHPTVTADAVAAGETKRSSTDDLMNIPTTVDWFNCVSYDRGDTWHCEYTHTTTTGTDHWVTENQWQTTSDCSVAHSPHCDRTLRAGAGGGGYRSEVSNETQDDRAPLSTEPPRCVDPQDVYVKAYCSGVPPTGARLERLNAALADMEAIGGECAALATIGRRVIANSAIRVYNGSTFRGFAGTAPMGGASYNPAANEWIALADYWFDRYYDYGTAHVASASLGGRRYLQEALAHEIEHLLGREHIPGDKYHTPNSKACSRT